MLSLVPESKQFNDAIHFHFLTIYSSFVFVCIFDSFLPSATHLPTISAESVHM